jgi:hypothetical protein
VAGQVERLRVAQRMQLRHSAVAARRKNEARRWWRRRARSGLFEGDRRDGKTLEGWAINLGERR